MHESTHTESTERATSGRSRRLILAGVALIVLAVGLATLSTAAVSADEYEIDADHGLADNESIEEYKSSGSASGDVDGLDATLSISEDKAGVGLDPYQRPADELNDFLEIEYNEDISRTLRIWIPSEYVTPHPREDVEAVGSDHTATYLEARDGEYLQVVITLDSSGTVVLPIAWHNQLSYDILGKYESRLEEVSGGDRAWRYIDRERIEEEHTVEVSVEDPENVAVQHDAQAGSTAERWVTTPRGSEGPDGVYWYVPDGEENETIYVVTRGEASPDVRVMDDPGYRQKATGWTNDAREIADRAQERIEDPLDGLLD